MKPAAFDYVLAENAEQALAVLAQEGDAARVLAGGQSLVPMLNMRLVRPGVVVDISRLHELAAIHADSHAISVGAMVRQADLLTHPRLADSHPLLSRVPVQLLLFGVEAIGAQQVAGRPGRFCHYVEIHDLTPNGPNIT